MSSQSIPEETPRRPNPVFDILHARYVLAGHQNDDVTQEYILKALRWLAKVKGAVVPAWVLQLVDPRRAPSLT